MTDQFPDNNKHIPRHIAIIMDGNGRWARLKTCRAWQAIAPAPKTCAGSSVPALILAFNT